MIWKTKLSIMLIFLEHSPILSVISDKPLLASPASGAMDTLKIRLTAHPCENYHLPPSQQSKARRPNVAYPVKMILKWLKKNQKKNNILRHVKIMWNSNFSAIIVTWPHSFAYVLSVTDFILKCRDELVVPVHLAQKCLKCLLSGP